MDLSGKERRKRRNECGMVVVLGNGSDNADGVGDCMCNEFILGVYCGVHCAIGVVRGKFDWISKVSDRCKKANSNVCAGKCS